MAEDRTPLGDAMTHRFPEQKIPSPQVDAGQGAHEVPSPDPVPPTGHPDPQPGDPKPKAPPAEDEPGRRTVPVELPGRPHAPERV